MALAEFIDGFVSCAMWLGKAYETAEDAENGDGSHLEEVCYPSDIPESVMAEIKSDCESFYDSHAHLWADEPNYDDSTAGFDFFLSRNGHGTGFWDRGLENGDEIHTATKPYGCFGLEKYGEEEICSHG